MTNEEAITYWEQLRKTFLESHDHTTNEIAKEHLQTSIDAIDTALAALNITLNYNLLARAEAAEQKLDATINQLHH